MKIETTSSRKMPLKTEYIERLREFDLLNNKNEIRDGNLKQIITDYFNGNKKQFDYNDLGYERVIMCNIAIIARDNQYFDDLISAFIDTQNDDQTHEYLSDDDSFLNSSDSDYTYSDYDYDYDAEVSDEMIYDYAISKEYTNNHSREVAELYSQRFTPCVPTIKLLYWECLYLASVHNNEHVFNVIKGVTDNKNQPVLNWLLTDKKFEHACVFLSNIDCELAGDEYLMYVIKDIPTKLMVLYMKCRLQSDINKINQKATAEEREYAKNKYTYEALVIMCLYHGRYDLIKVMLSPTSAEKELMRPYIDQHPIEIRGNDLWIGMSSMYYILQYIINSDTYHLIMEVIFHRMIDFDKIKSNVPEIDGNTSSRYVSIKMAEKIICGTICLNRTRISLKNRRIADMLHRLGFTIKNYEHIKSDIVSTCQPVCRNERDPGVDESVAKRIMIQESNKTQWDGGTKIPLAVFPCDCNIIIQ